MWCFFQKPEKARKQISPESPEREHRLSDTLTFGLLTSRTMRNSLCILSH